MVNFDRLRSYEEALAARNQELDAKIGSQLASLPACNARTALSTWTATHPGVAAAQALPLQPEPLGQAAADALQHLLKAAEVDETSWEEERSSGGAATLSDAW
jgi:hypothetical protein